MTTTTITIALILILVAGQSVVDAQASTCNASWYYTSNGVNYTMTRQTAAIWDLLGQGNTTGLKAWVKYNLANGNWSLTGISNSVNSSSSVGDAATCGTYANGVGKCDNSTIRTQSVYYSWTETNGSSSNRYVVSNSIPDHCYQVGATVTNPNSACEQYAVMVFPINPTYNSSGYTAHAMGAIGISVTGALLYNDKSAESTCNVAAISESSTFDPCNGHADTNCRYHYHMVPQCLTDYSSCALVGYAVDGFAVYGECAGLNMTTSYALNSGVTLSSTCMSVSDYTFTSGYGTLDLANGYYFTSAQTYNGVTFQAGTYAYFMTTAFPFIMPGYYGSMKYRFMYITGSLTSASGF